MWSSRIVGRVSKMNRVIFVLLVVFWLLVLTVVALLPLYVLGKVAVIFMFGVFAYITIKDVGRRGRRGT